jgi:hypothetical protein
MRAAVVLLAAALVVATAAATTPTEECLEASAAVKTCALEPSTSGGLDEECCASYRTTLSSCGGLGRLITNDFYTSLEDMGKILERTGDCRGTIPHHALLTVTLSPRLSVCRVNWSHSHRPSTCARIQIVHLPPRGRMVRSDGWRDVATCRHDGQSCIVFVVQ